MSAPHNYMRCYTRHFAGTGRSLQLWREERSVAIMFYRCDNYLVDTESLLSPLGDNRFTAPHNYRHQEKFSANRLLILEVL